MKNFPVILIKFYQKCISPAKRCKCPFMPSCSNYAVCALNEYGIVKGGLLSVWRILRCNPFNKGFFDPPEYWASKFGFNSVKFKNERI